MSEGYIKKGGQNPPTPSTSRPSPPVGSGAARIRELEAENARLRKDAERYRWLRDDGINQLPYEDGGPDFGPIYASHERLDAMIDAALEGK